MLLKEPVVGILRHAAHSLKKNQISNRQRRHFKAVFVTCWLKEPVVGILRHAAHSLKRTKFQTGNNDIFKAAVVTSWLKEPITIKGKIARF